MARFISVDTASAKSIEFDDLDKSSFSVNLYSAIDLSPQPDGKRWYISLQQCSLYYNHPNISAANKNNLVRYRVGAGVWKDVLFPDGIYSVQQIDAYINAVIEANGDGLLTGPAIHIYPNTSYGRVIIEIDSTIDFDLQDATTFNFRKLLGFDSQIVSGALGTTHQGESLPNVSNGVTGISIHCNLVGGSFVNGVPIDILYNYVLGGPSGSLQKIVPSPDNIWLPIQSTSSINSIRFALKTNTGEKWNPRGSDWTISVILERK